LDEVFSEENMGAVIARGDPASGLLQRGRLLTLMRGGPHPYDTARHARQILAAVVLAATGSPAAATDTFGELGLSSNPERTQQAMESLLRRLTVPPTGLNNLYLHVTFSCPLGCSHCYAKAGPTRTGELSVDALVRACREAVSLGFRQVIITGGEPLVHAQRDALLDTLAGLRVEVKPMLTVLRTSLSTPLDNDLLQRVCTSSDQVVVSVDGDRATHDARRGSGSYDRTVANLRAMVEHGYETDLSLATVLPLRLVNGPPGDAVRALGKELGIRRIRFRPVLPLGRATDQEPDIIPETLWGHVNPRDVVEFGVTPTATCGMGQNLYIEPDGAAYPCYAWHGDPWMLGRITDAGGLTGVMNAPAFRDLRNHTVNTNRKCRTCHLRFLCGGACRAWARASPEQQTDLDAPPVDCTHLLQRAESLLQSALDHLAISTERWLATGLPCP
jgi:uncharacterized protein